MLQFLFYVTWTSTIPDKPVIYIYIWYMVEDSVELTAMPTHFYTLDTNNTRDGQYIHTRYLMFCVYIAAIDSLF